MYYAHWHIFSCRVCDTVTDFKPNDKGFGCHAPPQSCDNNDARSVTLRALRDRNVITYGTRLH